MNPPWGRLGTLFLLLCLLLAGCYLASGERVHRRPFRQGHDGSVSGTFVSAEGTHRDTLQVGKPYAPVRLSLTAEVKQGELTLTFFYPDGSTAWEGTARSDRPLTAVTYLRSDHQGLVYYHLQAYEAREGSYTITYRIQEPPTPTPTPSPSLSPTPLP